MGKHDNNYRPNRSVARSYLTASIAVALAGAVYEYFSHGVYSFYMIYAFMIPLMIGCLPHMAGEGELERLAGDAGELLLAAGITTLTAGSLIKGVLEIYGTTNMLTRLYPILGITLLLAAAAVVIINRALRKAAG